MSTIKWHPLDNIIDGIFLNVNHRKNIKVDNWSGRLKG